MIKKKLDKNIKDKNINGMKLNVNFGIRTVKRKQNYTSNQSFTQDNSII